MEINIKKSLALLLVLSMAGFGQAVFFSPAAAKPASDTAVSAAFAPVVSVIKMAAFAPAQAKAVAAFGQCQGQSAAENNPVQGSKSINLNQPADCFDLSLGKIAAEYNLRVADLAQSLPAVKVLAIQPTIAPPDLLPLPENPIVPFLPILPLAFVAAVLLSEERFVRLLKHHFMGNPRLALSLAQLQVMRC